MKKANLMTTAALTTAIAFSTGTYAGNQTEEAIGNPPTPPIGAGGPMPMMGCQHGRMPMMHHQQGGMPMMGVPGGMRRPQMRQQMMAMRQQHMQTMETRLANIEALLQQLVELQKK